MSEAEPRDPAWAYAHCEALVRESDPDRWYSSLYAPAEKRPHLHALAAFHAMRLSVELPWLHAAAVEHAPGWTTEPEPDAAADAAADAATDPAAAADADDGGAGGELRADDHRLLAGQVEVVRLRGHASFL